MEKREREEVANKRRKEIREYEKRKRKTPLWNS
jgi:hypothetical protein